MNYKKDMLLILAIILMLGAAIQTARTDLASSIVSDRRFSGKMNGNYAPEKEDKSETDRYGKAGSPIIHIFYNSMKAE